MEELLTAGNIIMALGPATGVFLLAIYFIKTFVAYQKDVMLAMVDEMKADRTQSQQELEAFKNAVEKIDRRLEIMERLMDRRD